MRLDGAEGRHATVVRRLQPGERVDLVDGVGGRASGAVAEVAGPGLTVAVSRRIQEPPSAPRLVVVQALAKGDRGEQAVEAMTEVGVDEIVPWAASRSVAQWHGDRGERALARWRATAREAAKQSRRAWFPLVSPLVPTREVGARLAAAACPIVLHEDASLALAGLTVPGAGEVVLVVGPEGGISADELAALGAPAYRLGATVLRTSTAGVAALAVLAMRAGRWD